MDRIAAGEMTKGDVVGESRDLLHKTWTEIDEQPRGPGQSHLERDGRGPHPRPLQGLRRGRPQEGGRLAPHAADHPREKIGQTLRRLHRLDPRRPRVLRPDLPAAPARRRLQARRPLLGLRRDAAAQSRPLPRPPLEPLPQRRLRVDAGDEETPRRARSGESGQSGDGEKPPPEGDEDAPAKQAKAKRPKPTPPPAAANAPKRRPKAEAAAVVRLAGGSRRLGQEHPGEAARRGARPGDAADPRAGRDRRRRADPRAARRPGAGDRPLRRAAALLRGARRPAQPRDPAGAGGGRATSSPTASPTPASPTRAAPAGSAPATCSR